MPAHKKLREGSLPALRRHLLLSTALSGVVLAAAGQPAGASTITVTNTNDSGGGSLRAAITAANPGDTINVTPGLTGTITLGSNLPPANGVGIDLSAGSVSIAGPFGASFTTGSSSLNSSPANTYSGATALTSGSLSVSGNNGWAAYQSQLQMSGGTTFTANTPGPGATFASLSGAGTINLVGGNGNGLDLTGNDQQSTIFSGQITGSGGELALFGGGGTLTLTGTSNNYTGPTDIFGNVVVGTPGGGPLGATLVAGAANVFSPNSTVAMRGGTLAVLNLNNFNQTIGSLSGSGTVKLGSALLTLGGDNSSTTFTGTIAGTGGLDKMGSGTFTLGQTGGATYSGPTLIDGGVLSGGATNAFSPNSVVSIAPGATFAAGGGPGGGNSQTIAGLSGAGSVTVGTGQLTINPGAGVSNTFSGVISDAGSAGTSSSTLTIGGSGTQTLTGVNTYTGVTTVNSGTLALSGKGSIASSGQVAVNGGTFDVSGGGLLTQIQALTGTAALKAVSSNISDGVTFSGGGTVNVGSNTLIFGSSNLGTTLFPGRFTGSGGLVYSGTDTAILGGNSSGFSGTLLITSGTVAIGGDLPASFLGAAGVPITGAVFGGNVTINPGGTLSGRGTINGNVNVAPPAGGIGATGTNNFATVRPGGSIGTLTVNGNYTQGANGVLAIEVSPTTSSRLVVGGAASLAGTLQLMYDPGIYVAGTAYNFLTASSVTGSFSSIVSNNPNIDQTLVFGPNGVSALLTRVAPINDTVYTDVTSTLVLNGQRANSIILDRVGNRAAGVSDGEVALAGPGVPGPQLAQAGNGAALGDVASALPGALTSQGMWFRGLGDFTSVGGSGGAPGFNGSAGGFLAGYDRPVAPNTYLGVAGGYLHSNASESGTGSSGAADTVRLAVYGGSFLGQSLLTGTAGYAHDRIDTDRPFAGFGTAYENHNGNEATAAGQWSLPLEVQGLGQGIATVTPKTGLQYLHLDENAFNETGAGGLDLSSGGKSTDSLQPFVAVSAAQKFVTSGGMLVTPEVRVGYDREVLSGARSLTVASVTGVTFPVSGVKPSSDIFTAGAGVTLNYAPNLALYATYDAIVPTGNTTDQTVQAGLRIKF